MSSPSQSSQEEGKTDEEFEAHVWEHLSPGVSRKSKSRIFSERDEVQYQMGEIPHKGEEQIDEFHDQVEEEGGGTPPYETEQNRKHSTTNTSFSSSPRNSHSENVPKKRKIEVYQDPETSFSEIVNLKDQELDSYEHQIQQLEHELEKERQVSKELSIALDIERKRKKILEEKINQQAPDLKKHFESQQESLNLKILSLDKTLKNSELESNKKIKSLTQEIIKLTSEAASTKDQLRTIQKQSKHAESMLTEKQTENNYLKNEVKKKDDEITKLKLEMENLKKECESSRKKMDDETRKLRNLEQKLETLDDYEVMYKELKEELMVYRNYKQKYENISRENEEIKKKLENTLILKEKIRQLRNENDRLKSLEEERMKFALEIEELKEENSKLKKTIQELEGELETYESRVGKGHDYNVRKTKILHMTINPTVEAKAQSDANLLEKLKSEVKLLKEKLEESQQHLGNKSGETLKLKADYELHYRRLKEVFQQKSTDFRRCVYLLFGFRMDVISDNQYRLSSMYAEREEDYLLFEYNDKERKMNLLETDFSVNLPKDTLNLLIQFGSYPSFLSQITLDLFNRQTIFQQNNKN